MGQRARKLLAKLSPLIPMQRLIALSGQRLLLPVYHLVSNEECKHADLLYTIPDAEDFEDDLDFLLQHFQPIAAHEIEAHLQNPPAHKPAFHLSFDDGLRECYDVVAPILKRKGVPATFFLITDFVDNKGLMFRNKANLLTHAFYEHKADKDLTEALLDIGLTGTLRKFFKDIFLNVSYEDRAMLDQAAPLLEVDFNEFLREQKPYMTTEQIQSLLKDGFTIGSHSHDHPMFSTLTSGDRRWEVTSTIKWLQEKFGITEHLFAFPFTDHGVPAEFFFEMHDAEKPLVDFSFGCAGLKQDIVPRHLQRVGMDDLILPARKSIPAEYLYYLLKQPLGKNQLQR